MENTRKTALKKALLIGFIFCFAYMLSYYVRKLLGLSRDTILGLGLFGAGQLDTMQSVYLVMYAAGQLVNGIIGDFAPPKRMITIGFILSGAAIVVFPLTEVFWISVLCFAVFGYGLSMLRGPMMKLITASVEPQYARTICAFFSFFCSFSTFIATFFIMLLGWKYAFLVSGILILAFAAFLFVFISVMEKKKAFDLPEPEEAKKISVREILKVFTLPNFVYFLFIGGICEIFGTTLSYWMPSFIHGFLGQTEDFSKVVTSAIALITSVSSFLALVLYRLCKGKVKLVIFILFAVSAVCFALMLPISDLWIRLFVFLIAMILTGIVSSTLWSIYIPSLGSSGHVSGANGVLDCAGYLFAALANEVFSLIAGDPDNPGWTQLIIAWIAIAVLGCLLTVFKRDKKETENA